MEIWAMPTVKMLLLGIFFLALLVEIKTAGMGVGALIGLIAAAVFFGSQYVSGLVSLYEIAIFLAGVGFIALEILTPGIGLFAGLGMAAVLYSFMLALGGDIMAVYLMLGSLAAAVVAFVVIIKRLPTSKLWQKLVLRSSSKTEQGYVSTPEDFSGFIGMTGRAVTGLRPAGAAVFSGRRLDVVSEGDFIEKNSEVIVIAVQGNRIVVRYKAN